MAYVFLFAILETLLLVPLAGLATLAGLWLARKGGAA